MPILCVTNFGAKTRFLSKGKLPGMRTPRLEVFRQTSAKTFSTAFSVETLPQTYVEVYSRSKNCISVFFTFFFIKSTAAKIQAKSLLFSFSSFQSIDLSFFLLSSTMADGGLLPEPVLPWNAPVNDPPIEETAIEDDGNPVNDGRNPVVETVVEDTVVVDQDAADV